MPECENLDDCYFFIEFGENPDVDCEEIIQLYCKGPKMAECKRKEFKDQQGYPPPPDILPDGTSIKDRL